MACLARLATSPLRAFVRVLGAAAALTLAACSSTPATTSGANGRAVFQYSGCLGDDCALTSRGIAAGARESILVKSETKVARAASSDASILAVLEVTDGSGGELVSLAAGKPGTATLTVYDAADREIDHVAVLVAATKTIATDPGWPAEGPYVLVGDAFAVHATTLGADGERLAGDGAIAFTYQGAIERDDSFFICFGDCDQFRAKLPGEGQIVLGAVSATNTLPVHVVAGTSIDALAFEHVSVDASVGDLSSVAFTMGAGGKTVHGRGLSCASATPAVATLGAVAPAALTEVRSGAVGFNALAAGTATFTCAINGKSASFDVRVK